MDEWQARYAEQQPLLEAFLAEVRGPLGRLIAHGGVRLALPVEGRVKSISSIRDKCERHGWTLQSLDQIRDLIGLRVVTLFERDAETACELIDDSFTVLERDDTRSRLGESRFGYGSVHYQVKLREPWLAVPTLRRFEALCVEIQVRTVAQHLWAAASHVLQYKREQDVPLTLRRSINRVAALLETADVEFERVLLQRDGYRARLDELTVEPEEELNRDSLEQLLSSIWPAKNYGPLDPYSDLLEDLLKAGISRPEQLRGDIEDYRQVVLRQDAAYASEMAEAFGDNDKGARARSGVWFTHTALTRAALDLARPGWASKKRSNP